MASKDARDSMVIFVMLGMLALIGFLCVSGAVADGTKKK
jgi:hypothetical protein